MVRGVWGDFVPGGGRGVSSPGDVPGLGGVLSPGGVCSQGVSAPGGGGVLGLGGPGPGGVPAWSGGVYLVRGCLLWGVYLVGGSAPEEGGLLPGGAPGPGRCTCLVRGGVPAQVLFPPPPVNRILDTRL